MTRKTKISILCCMALILSSTVFAADKTIGRNRASGQRIAIVIGNGAYPFASRLDDPVHDARGMAKTLRGLGFEVTEKENLRFQEMSESVTEFGERLIRRGEIVMTDNRSLLHQLLYHALTDIREAACEGNSKAAFRLSDLIHTIPLELERVTKEGGDYAEILNGLRERARQKGCESWINNALRHYLEPYESVSETGYSGQRDLQAEDAEWVQIV